MKTTIINQSDVKSVIASIPNSAIFSVVFTKKDKTIRDMNCRKGVKCGLKEGAKKIAPDTKNIIVYDMEIAKVEADPSKAYRKINPETVLSIRANKQTYLVRG